MDFLNNILIALALAMDAFTVAISSGASLKRVKAKTALLVALYFGFFQFAMTLIGFLGGRFFSAFIDSFDHWIALGLLIIIGGRMIWVSLKSAGDKKFSLSHKILLVLALATSIDALGVGLSYAFLNQSLYIPAIIIGIVAFIFSGFGVYLGKFLKQLLKNKAGLVGGLILIGIGLKLAFDHGAFNN